MPKLCVVPTGSGVNKFLKLFSDRCCYQFLFPGQQDGGEGKTGRVMEIRGWDNESCRSVANVSWVTGSTNVYRLGHKGNVDLKYIQPAAGGYYYRDHMPVLGNISTVCFTS